MSFHQGLLTLAPFKPNLIESLRFRLAKYSVEVASGCREWTRCARPYGELNIGRHCAVVAHRAAWLLAHGDIPAGMVVAHKCDNPRCINVEHLYVGTQLQNVADTIARGRARKPRLLGERNPQAALTETLVLELRARYARGDCTAVDLANEYGLSATTVGPAIKGTTWTHVPGAIPLTNRRQRNFGGRPKLTDEQAVEILESGEPGVVLALRYGVSTSLISKVRRGFRWGAAIGARQSREVHSADPVTEGRR
jgi:hypothetical protein